MEQITVIYVILLACGILPLALALFKQWKILSFKKKAITTIASITHVEKRVLYSGGAKYKLTLQYKTGDSGQIYIARFVSWNKFKTGDTLPLMYLPEKPENFKIDLQKKTTYGIVATIVFFLLIVWFCYWLSSLEYTSG